MNREFQFLNINSQELLPLLPHCKRFNFPFVGKRFGWAIIEAQACSCPVFTSNRKQMPEVGGDDVMGFDPENEAEAAQAISDALRNKDSLTDLGFQNAMRYSTKAMISGYESIYHSVVR